MPSLAELQRTFARAMTTGDGAALERHLVGGAEPIARLAIHLAHYHMSLVEALCEKFPACAWLAGASVVREAAGEYARAHPPSKPCIAEYGHDFPRFLADHARARRLPYLESFAELEWAVGKASIAIATPPLSWDELACHDAERLVEATLELQPGLRYVRAASRIDELMQTYLCDAAPERFVLLDSPTFIEVHGARGELRLARLGAPAFEFRAALAAGRTIGDAAEAALALDASFDAGGALRALVDARLVTGISTRAPEAER